MDSPSSSAPPVGATRYRRLEWVMLDWNPAADFYAALGAEVVRDWLPYRLSGDALRRLAERASPAQPIRG
jgi:hypothetical protein